MADGKTNPFGNGSGKAGGSNVAGNNFLINPGGSGKGELTQKPYTPDINTNHSAPGGSLPLVQAAPEQAGVGSVGNGAKPFRVS